MGISFGEMEQALMAAGATVSSVAKDATTTAVPLTDVLVAGDFVGGRMYLSSAVVPWNGSSTSPTPGTWIEIAAQEAAPVVGTAIIVPAAALAAIPVAGVRVYLLRPSQSGGTIGKVDQGAPGSSAWPVTNQPVALDTVADGTALDAEGMLLSSNAVIAADGFVLLAFAPKSTAAATALQHSRDAGATTPEWPNLRRGRSWYPGDEYDIAIPVYKGDVWNARVVTATTVGTVRALFAPSI